MRETRMKFITPIVMAFACAFATSAFAAQATFYQLPPGAYPHDVAPAPDGTVWYSGQQKGILGRFDPKTGKNEEIPLGSGAAPSRGPGRELAPAAISRRYSRPTHRADSRREPG